MADDWRLRVTLEDRHGLSALSERLAARDLEKEVASQLGDGVAVSRDGTELFLYTGTEEALRAAERVVRQDLDEHGLEATLEMTRWHEDAEDWEPVGAALPQTDEEREAEHERLMEREDAGNLGWEVRVEFGTRDEARALEESLEQRGVNPVRRFKYVLVGAPDEDAAREWAEELKGEAPGAEITVEGTYAGTERTNPFSIFGAGTGDP